MILHTANKDSRTYQQEKEMEISVDIVAEDNMVEVADVVQEGKEGGMIIQTTYRPPHPPPFSVLLHHQQLQVVLLLPSHPGLLE